MSEIWNNYHFFGVIEVEWRAFKQPILRATFLYMGECLFSFPLFIFQKMTLSFMKKSEYCKNVKVCGFMCFMRLFFISISEGDEQKSKHYNIVWGI